MKEIEYSAIGDNPAYANLKKKRAIRDAAKDHMFSLMEKGAQRGDELYEAALSKWGESMKDFQNTLTKSKMAENFDTGEFSRRSAYPDLLQKKYGPDIPSEFLPIKKKGLTLLKSVGPIAAIGGALAMPDMAQAAVDFIVPGGVESMGVSPEQVDLDKQYKQRIRSRQEALNLLPH